MKAPRFLSQGDRIALVSPASKLSEASTQKAAALLWGWGYEPVIGPGAHRLFREIYSGTPEERAAELKWALEDPTISAIICCRGGYGSLHLLPLLPEGIFAANPKWIVGFSDITTIHSLAVCDGVMSIHGPMGATFLDDTASDEMLRRMLAGELPRYATGAHPCNYFGSTEGILVGGNLCSFTPLAGTGRDFLEKEGLILFIEEVGESFHNIDRLINTLKLRGVLNRVKGIILGDFTDCTRDIGWDSIEEMISHYTKGIPVCCGFPAGHAKANLPLIEGAKVRLEVSEQGSSLSYFLPL